MASTTKAYDLCHRATAGKNSRHVERKVFKMRELQHAGKVKLVLVPTNERSDMFNKPRLGNVRTASDSVMVAAAAARIIGPESVTTWGGGV